MSRFVSGGTNEDPTERDDEWRKAQAELDAKHMQKIEASRQQDGKSLFETLQANKAAKQDAFEESQRLTNQFQSLNEDDVEFLDSVLASKRNKDSEVKKQTTEQLEAFRQQQEDAEKAAKQQDAPEVATDLAGSWAVGSKKRKKGQEKGVIPGVKLKKMSTGDQEKSRSPNAVTDTSSATTSSLPAKKASPQSKEVNASSSAEARSEAKATTDAAAPAPQTKSASPPATALGLAGYSSDEDD